MQGFDLTAILLNPEYSAMLVRGVGMTFVIALGSWLLAMTLGMLLLAIRQAGRIPDGTVAAYVLSLIHI